jgi:RHS repeat-associated protein
VLTFSGATSKYTYNGDGRQDESLHRREHDEHVWDVAAGLPVILQDGTNTYVYGLGLISTYDGDDMTYRLTDGLGSTMNLCDASGNELVTYAYDVFGALRSQTGSSDNDRLFTGEQRDEESGYDYLRARYYDPEVGRFLSSDPLGGGYPYGANNPANLVDPSGLTEERVDVCTDWRDGVCSGTTSIAAEYSQYYYVAVDVPGETPSDSVTRVVFSGASGEFLQAVKYSPNPGWKILRAIKIKLPDLGISAQDVKNAVVGTTLIVAGVAVLAGDIAIASIVIGHEIAACSQAVFVEELFIICGVIIPHSIGLFSAIGAGAIGTIICGADIILSGECLGESNGSGM